MKVNRGRRGRHATRVLTLLLILGGWTLIDRVWAEGIEAPPSSRRVIFDQGHGQRFLVEQEGSLDLSKLAEVFRSEGFRVDVNRELVTEKVLTGATGLVISGPFAAFQPAEIEAIAAFVEHGGRLCVTLHIAPPAGPLLGRLGVVASNGVVHEMANIVGDNDLNFRVTRTRPHPVTAGVAEFNVYGSWALINGTADTEVVARSTSRAWVDLNGNGSFDGDPEMRQSFGTAVAGQFGKGELIAFGDDAIFQNQFLHDGNLVLAQKLARWMAGG